jgi:hypothetical protein
MSNNLESVHAACDNRAFFLSFAQPGPRVDIVSPYPRFTQLQLDMRRKVEILKYKQQTLNSDITTKAKKWAKVVQLSRKNPLAINKRACPMDSLLPTPSTSCDVPGPAITLQYDPTVELYNYGYIPPTYNTENESKYVDWEAFEIEDAEFPQNTSSPLAYVVVQHPKKIKYNYKFQTPVAIYLSGYKDIRSYNKKTSYINITISSISCEITFNNKMITKVHPVIQPMVNNILLSVVNSENGYFEVSKYIGMVYVSNIVLPVQAQYVYEVNMTFQVKYTFLDDASQPIQENTDISKIEPMVIANLTGPNDYYYFQTNNCNTSRDINIPFTNFYLSST